MSNSSSTANGGIGIVGLLGVAFVVLKLTGHITWSWWWVTAPFWGGLALFLGVVTIVGVIAAIASAFESEEEKRARQARDRLRALSDRLSRR